MQEIHRKFAKIVVTEVRCVTIFGSDSYPDRSFVPFWGFLRSEKGLGRAKFWAKFTFWRGAVRGEVFGEVCWKRGKDPHPQDFSLTKKTARFTKGQFRPY